MVILDLWGISFHPAVVVGLGNDLLFNSILAHCALIISIHEETYQLNLVLGTEL